MSQGYFTDDSVLRRVHQERPQVRAPRAEQIVARTGHAVEEEDPQLVID